MIGDAWFPNLKQAVIAHTGLAYWADKDAELSRLLGGVCGDLGLTPGELARRLDREAGHGETTDAVVAAVTVGETFFFRYREQFAALETVILPERLAANGANKALSVWSAGCSIGAEPYSIAMALRRAGLPADWRLCIVGTDVDRSAVEAARRGAFRDWALRGLPEAERRIFFTPDGNNWRVRDVYRRGVSFLHHNLLCDPRPEGTAPGGRFDVVFCRNVLMYFDARTRARVLLSLAAAIADGGWLVVGHAEAGPEVLRWFQPVRVPGAFLFRRAPPKVLPPVRKVGKPRGDAPARTVAPPARVGRSFEARIRALLDRGDHHAAALRAQAWVKAAPFDPLAHILLGLALEPGSREQAVAEMRRAVYLDGGNVLAHFHLMRLLAGRGESERHRRALLAALAGMPADAPIPHGEGLKVADLAAVARHLSGTGGG